MDLIPRVSECEEATQSRPSNPPSTGLLTSQPEKGRKGNICLEVIRSCRMMYNLYQSIGLSERQNCPLPSAVSSLLKRDDEYMKRIQPSLLQPRYRRWSLQEKGNICLEAIGSRNAACNLYRGIDRAERHNLPLPLTGFPDL